MKSQVKNYFQKMKDESEKEKKVKDERIADLEEKLKKSEELV